MKEKTLLFMAVFMLFFLTACSSPFGSNEIPADAPAEIQMPAIGDETVIAETAGDEVIESDSDFEMNLNSFDEAVETEEELEGLEAEVDELFNEYEEIYQ